MFLRHLSAALASLATIRGVCGQALAMPPPTSYAYLSTGASAPTRRATCAGGQTVKNAACCAWFPVLDDIKENFFDNECGDDVRYRFVVEGFFN